MSAIVPYTRTNPRYQEVAISESTRGRLFRDLGLLLHWVRGHGAQIIPGHRPAVELSTSGSATLRYRVHPGGQAIARLWVLALRQEDPASVSSMSELEVTFPDGVTVSYVPPSVTSFGGVVTRRLYLEELSAKSGAEQELTLSLSHAAGAGDLYVDSVACFEVPRAVLSLDEEDLGVDLETLAPGRPMYEGAQRSIFGVAQGIAATRPRRHLCTMHFPEVETTSGTFTDVFGVALPVIASKWLTSDTTAELTWRVYAAASDGTTSGEYRITTGNSANTSTVSMGTGSSSYSWLERGTVEADCEDPGDAEGLPSGGLETVQLAFRRTAGAGSVRAKALSIWEAG